MVNPNAKRDQARIDEIITEIYEMQQRPGSRELTSNDLRLRERSRTHMASQILINGGKVRPEYMNGNE
jgi:hypothetical protein